MQIVIKKIHNVEKAADLALKNRLFVPGWQLGEILRNINRLKCEIALAFENETPIGICLKIYYEPENQLHVFVRKRCRKQGIGRRLISLLKDDKSYGEIGIKKSNGKIWELNGVCLK